MAEENINVDEVPIEAVQGADDGAAPEGESSIDGSEVEIEEGEEAEEPEEEQPPEEIHLKTKTVPAVVMLIGGAATAISCYVKGYPLLRMLLIVFAALLCFWILGGIIKIFLDKIVIAPPEEEAKEEEEELSDGEVIEKTPGATDTTE